MMRRKNISIFIATIFISLVAMSSVYSVLPISKDIYSIEEKSESEKSKEPNNSEKEFEEAEKNFFYSDFIQTNSLSKSLAYIEYVQSIRKLCYLDTFCPPPEFI